MSFISGTVELNFKEAQFLLLKNSLFITSGNSSILRFTVLSDSEVSFKILFSDLNHQTQYLQQFTSTLWQLSFVVWSFFALELNSDNSKDTSWILPCSDEELRYFPAFKISTLFSLYCGSCSNVAPVRHYFWEILGTGRIDHRESHFFSLTMRRNLAYSSLYSIFSVVVISKKNRSYCLNSLQHSAIMKFNLCRLTAKHTRIMSNIATDCSLQPSFDLSLNDWPIDCLVTVFFLLSIFQ